jgi:hypothetical protein
MKLTALLLAALLIPAVSSDAFAKPKTSAGGYTCISTGTARKVGTDQDGHKLDCLWDTCTYCAVGSTINCSKLTTEYSNARDCHPARMGAAGGAGITAIPNGGLRLSPGKPPGVKPKPRPTIPPIVRNGGMRLKNFGGSGGSGVIQ